jgi:hypothetical protein
MKKIFAVFVGVLFLQNVYAQLVLLKTQPRLMYNYLLFTDTLLDFQHLHSTLPEGARMQLTDDVSKVKRVELIQFKNRGDSIDRFWYVNNTIFTQCRIVVYQNNKKIEDILFWPNAESVEVDTRLLNGTKYSINVMQDEVILEERDILESKIEY